MLSILSLKFFLALLSSFSSSYRFSFLDLSQRLTLMLLRVFSPRGIRSTTRLLGLFLRLLLTLQHSLLFLLLEGCQLLLLLRSSFLLLSLLPLLMLLLFLIDQIIFSVLRRHLLMLLYLLLLCLLLLK
mmetsp:Transcript_104772/g.295170  ORF Transcript_104772/g.295170 Transcript_104772/m.295170 type:complete len:128 (+) Transcript_104772:617-1000(+)